MMKRLACRAEEKKEARYPIAPGEKGSFSQRGTEVCRGLGSGREGVLRESWWRKRVAWGKGEKSLKNGMEKGESRLSADNG